MQYILILKVKFNFVNKDVVEVCSPVGSWESLHAAIDAGADSVYLGVGSLNMRSTSAYNFDINELPKLVRICRENNVNIYVTVNTIIYDNEIENLIVLLNLLKNIGIDAVIASDMAVLLECRRLDISVHASTQLNISNVNALKFYAQFCDAVILARELSLRQVAHICRAIEQENIFGPSKSPVRIKIFAHGAMCMSISGKCYLSEDIFNRSANRGDCAQVCRRPYMILQELENDSKTELLIDGQYILSPKDLKTIDFLDAIVEAGVSILKIEGRARSPEYVYTVTKVYKEALNAIKDKQFNNENLERWNKQLQSVFNRGFWEGYYLGRTVPVTAKTWGSEAEIVKVYVGRVLNYFSRIKVIEIVVEAGDIQVGDDILIIGETTGVVNFKISEIRVDLEQTLKAEKGTHCSIPVTTLVRRNDKVYKLVKNPKV